MSRRISAKERTEVIGVLSSWLTWLRNSSFWASSASSRSLAARSWAALFSASALVARSASVVRMRRAFSSAISMSSSSEIEFALGDAADHGVRRGGADRARELALEPRDEGRRRVGQAAEPALRPAASWKSAEA